MTDNELLLAISDMMDKKLKLIKDDIHMLKLQNENDILPRLQNIEAGYTSTYDRYKSGVAQIDVMQINIEFLQEHSEKLQKIS